MPEPDKQLTQPKGVDENGEPYEPIEIPIPSESDVFDDLAKLAGKSSSNEDKESSENLHN
jgi:hypothetical protein